MKHEKPLKRWLNPNELLEEYGFGLSNQQKLRAKQKIPFSKIGRYIRYDRKDIDLWLENNKVDMRA